MDPACEHQACVTRRQFFGTSALGIGAAALASLLNSEAMGADAPKRFGGLPDLPHFAPKAKRVIYMFQNGAPSHVDLFDYKPKLKEWQGKPIPPEIVGNKRFSTMSPGNKPKLVIAEITKFARHGQSGAWVSDFLPHTAAIADDLCFVKSMF